MREMLEVEYKEKVEKDVTTAQTQSTESLQQTVQKLKQVGALLLVINTQVLEYIKMLPCALI